MYKLIALDMDGTLFTSDKKITDRTKKAIAAAHAQGVKIVLASGRPLDGLHKPLAELNLISDNEYVLCYNGALAVTAKSGTILSQCTLTGDDCKRLFALAQQIGVHCHAFSTKQGLITNETSEYTEYEARLNEMTYTIINPQTDIADDEIIIKVMFIDPPEILNEAVKKVPDWVYEEEFGFSSAMQWSSDSELLSFIRFNETNVKQFSFPLYGSYSPDYPQYELYPGSMQYKYPVAGETNSQVSVVTYTVETRALKKHDIPVNPDGYIPRIFALPEADYFAVVTLNRTQNQLCLYRLNARSGVTRLLIEDRDDAWIDQNVLDMFAFYPDFFTFASDRDGYLRIYKCNNNGIVQKAISPEREDVTEFLGYNSTTQTFYCQATAGALNRAIYRYDSKNGIVNLTPEAGTHSALFNPSCTYYIHGYNSATTPPMYTLRNAAGKDIRPIVENSALVEKIRIHRQTI